MLLFPKTLSHRALWRLVAAPGQYYHWLLETIVKNFIGLENEVHGAGTVYRRGGVGLARKAAAASAGAGYDRRDKGCCAISHGAAGNHPLRWGGQDQRCAARHGRRDAVEAGLGCIEFDDDGAAAGDRSR